MIIDYVNLKNYVLGFLIGPNSLLCSWYGWKLREKKKKKNVQILFKKCQLKNVGH